MPKKITNTIHHCDSRYIDKLLPKNPIIQTTITSPPYFDMKDYGVDNQIGFGQTYDKYLDDLQDVFHKVFEKTSNNGTLWIVIDTFKRNHSVVPLPFDLANKLTKIGWHFQDIIIWKKDKTVPWSSDGFVQRKIEYILFFSKTVRFKYNKDVTRVYDTQQLKRWWVKYPERYNPKGKVVDEVWEYPIPVQGAWGDKYIRHFCPLPKDMVATMISLSTDENDIVLDPFAGSGAVLAQAAYMKRKYLGVELNNNYIEQFNQYLHNTLKEGRKEYEKKKQTLDQKQFETVIWQLRALKYGRVLLNSLEKTIKKHSFKVVVTQQDFQKGKLSVEYIFITTESMEKTCDTIIQEFINSKPLKLYGILPVIKYCKPEMINLQDYYMYSSTNSHSYIKQQDNLAKAKVFSKIKLDIDEKQYD